MAAHTVKNIFRADNFPGMQEELLSPDSQLTVMPKYFKADITISYLKVHRIKNEWVKANPELVSFLLHGSFISKHTEALFNFCRYLLVFFSDFENYMKKTLLH